MMLCMVSQGNGAKIRCDLDLSCRNALLTPASNILLTGATGLLGGELMRALLAVPVRRIWALVRPTHKDPIATRLAHRLGRNGEGLGGLEACLMPVSGDVAEPRLGMCSRDAEGISREADIVIHCAATTSFVRGAECRQSAYAEY